MKGITIPVIAAWAGAWAAQAATNTSDLIPEPQWTHLPAEEAIGSLYPAAADRRHQPGDATMQCSINDAGSLRACIVVDERPADAGFGSKALQLVPQFRAKTRAADGTSVRGRTVVVSVRFTPTGWARMLDQGVASVAPAFPQVARWVVGPDWSPSYPPKARPSGVAGRVVLHCVAMSEGLLANCVVASETPKNLGFGEQSVQSARSMRVSRVALDGTPTQGRTFEVPIVINPPCFNLSDAERLLNGCPTRPLSSYAY